jgi:hypothetical protein
MGIFLTSNLPWNDGKLPQYDSKFYPINNMVFLPWQFTMKNYRNSFITLAPGVNVIKLFSFIADDEA